MALNHNSRVAASEPAWGGVAKSKLPQQAFAEHGEANKKSTWKFPHHWVKGGGGMNDDGVYTTGELFLHRGGLNAAWSAAQGGRSGQEASQAVKAHLQVHRKALGMKGNATMPDPVAGSTGSADEFDICRQPDKTTITKNGKRRHTVEDNHLSIKQEDPLAKNGSIEGYASQFDLVDFQREVVRKGAFSKTIAEQDGKIVLSAKHFARGGDIEHAVATIVELKEDDYGLWFKAHWYGDDASQFVRQKVMEMRAAGVKVFSSIGYMPIKWGFIKSADGAMTLIELTEIALKEVTLTLNPANEGAIILDAKTVKPGDVIDPDNNGAGSSDADDGQGSDEPHVTNGTAAKTGEQDKGGDNSPDGPTAALPTVVEADPHSDDAEVIEAQAKATLARAKAVLVDAQLAELDDADGEGE